MQVEGATKHLKLEVNTGAHCTLNNFEVQTADMEVSTGARCTLNNIEVQTADMKVSTGAVAQLPRVKQSGTLQCSLNATCMLPKYSPVKVDASLGAKVIEQ